jgi:hypothetical protein
MTDAYTPGPQPPQAGGFSLAEGQVDPMMMGADPMMMGGPPPPQKLYDVKIKRCIKSGRPKLRIVAPEDFRCDPEAMAVGEDDGRFFADCSRPTRSDLIRRFPKQRKQIEELPSHGSRLTNSEEKEARDRNQWKGEQNRDPSQDQIEVWEMYVNVDYDGDGVSEWRQVVMAGGTGSMVMLDHAEWGGMLPYTDIVPNPIPHRRRGRSLFEDLYDIQRIKSVVLRMIMDSGYIALNPRQVLNKSSIVNMDVAMQYGIGDSIIANGDASTAVMPLTVPFVGKDVFPILQYYDEMGEKRTGVSRSTMGLDLDALQNQTATAVNAQQSAAYTKIETYARNIAEAGGLKRLFKCLLRLLVENQRVPKMIKLRNQWVKMDPKGWNADMDCTINVGLGAGSRDRDLATLQAVAAKQELFVQALGPYNPICNVGHLSETYRKLAEASMLKNPEAYFPEIGQQQVQQMAQQAAQAPNPEAAKAQAQAQVEQMKLHANMQMAQAKQQADDRKAAMDFQREQQADERKAQIEQVQMQADIATNQQKVAAEMQIAREQFEFDKQIKLLEHQAKMAEIQANAQIKMQEAQIKQEQMREQHQMGMAQAAHSAEMGREAHDQKLEQSEAAAKAKNAKPKSAS